MVRRWQRAGFVLMSPIAVIPKAKTGRNLGGNEALSPQTAPVTQPLPRCLQIKDSFQRMRVNGVSFEGITESFDVLGASFGDGITCIIRVITAVICNPVRRVDAWG